MSNEPSEARQAPARKSIAHRNNFLIFEAYLNRMAQFGNGQSKLEAKTAEKILEFYNACKEGYAGLKCQCGKEAVTTRLFQPVPTYPRETYSVCREHADAIDLMAKFGADVAKSNP
jgi:hypothetical protein